MSFTITLYDCADDPRKLNKTLSGGTQVAGVKPTGIVDLMSPTFELNYNSAYTTKNYCEVGAPFNRSYFITDMQIDIGKKIIISCAVDVLQTYRGEISGINANVVRQENLIKEMLPDPNFVYLDQSDVIGVLADNYESTIFGPQVPGGYYVVLGVNGSANAHVNDVDGFTKLDSAPADWSMRYIFYWVNTGSTSEPSMISIGELVSQGALPQNVSYNDVVAAYGAVYYKDMV